MKYLLALMIVFSGLQPFTLQACDMAADTSAPQHAAMDHSMDREEPMQHSGHDMKECCDPADRDTEMNCPASQPCAPTAPAMFTFPSPLLGLAAPEPQNTPQFATAAYSGPAASPLYRPPIS